jgi:hypothetical protein
MNTPTTASIPRTLTKHKAVLLRDLGLDEKWLQQEIYKDPSIIGLGELICFSKEKSQGAGGRLDLLLLDQESEPETMYEVELMRGATDESHIIRTIEYWDIESRRYPNREHRAVIIAEEITNRFFNVIWLLSRSIPIIAIQVTPILLEDKLLLTFTKVLDLFEPPDTDDEDQSKPSDRATWEIRAPGGIEVSMLWWPFSKGTECLRRQTTIETTGSDWEEQGGAILCPSR